MTFGDARPRRDGRARPVLRRHRPPRAACSPTGVSRDDPAGLETFALGVVEAVAPYVSVVKPQSAFYERFGSRGVAVLERVIAESRAAGALVLLDVKRGDIGSTSQAYADAYLDPASPLAADAITASPFLGLRLARPDDRDRPPPRRRRVRARADLQQGGPRGPARDRRGRRHRRRPACSDRLRELNAGADPLGSFGAVVGATIGETGRGPRRSTARCWRPATASRAGARPTSARIFGAAAPHVLASSSRGVLRLGPDRAAMTDAGPPRQRRARGRRSREARGPDAACWPASLAGAATAPRTSAPTTARRSRSSRSRSPRRWPRSRPTPCSARCRSSVSSPRTPRGTSRTTGPRSRRARRARGGARRGRGRRASYDAEQPPEDVTEEQQAGHRRGLPTSSPPRRGRRLRGRQAARQGRLQDTAVPVIGAAARRRRLQPRNRLTRLTADPAPRSSLTTKEIRDPWPCLLSPRNSEPRRSRRPPRPDGSGPR